MPLNVERTYLRMQKLAADIIRRLVAANAFYLDKVGRRTAHQKPKRLAVMPTVLEWQLQSSQHAMAVQGRFLKDMPSCTVCTRCGQGVARSSLKRFLGTRCVPGQAFSYWGGASTAFARLAHQQAVHVGHGELHDSHALAYHRGVWWCLMCGAYATVGDKPGAKRLHHPCAPPTRAGRDYLRRLAKGRPPKVGVEWPFPESPCWARPCWLAAAPVPVEAPLSGAKQTQG